MCVCEREGVCVLSRVGTMLSGQVREALPDTNCDLYVVCTALSIQCTIQWNLSMKYTANKGHLSNEDAACSPNTLGMSTNLPLNQGQLSIGQPAGSQWCPL